jgi:hypothetical protein
VAAEPDIVLMNQLTQWQNNCHYRTKQYKQFLCHYQAMSVQLVACFLVAMDGCGTKHFEVSPDGRYLAFFGNYGHIHLLTAQVFLWSTWTCFKRFSNAIELCSKTADNMVREQGDIGKTVRGVMQFNCEQYTVLSSPELEYFGFMECILGY